MIYRNNLLLISSSLQIEDCYHKSTIYHSHKTILRKPRRNYTVKELDGETGLYYYGARYLDPKTSRWLSTDPAMGEYVPSAPVNEEARKRNGNLPGMGGVFNYVNLHVYHYAGNNPVKYLDPDGREVTIDYENKIIYADDNNVKDLDEANRYLMGFKNMKKWQDMKVVTRDEKGNNVNTFSHPGELLGYIESIDPTMTEKEKNRLVGLGFSLAGAIIVFLSVKGMRSQPASSTDANNANGFKLGLNITIIGVTQFVTGDNLIGSAGEFIETYILDPKTEVIKDINKRLPGIKE